MISIDITNRLFTVFAKLVNILDFNPKRLNIYYINYEKVLFI